MKNREEYTSPDGSLRLLVLRDHGDVTIGFHGYPWHTHGDVVAGELALLGVAVDTPEAAAQQFVADILSGRIPIAIVRQGEQIQDVLAAYLFESLPGGDEVKLRRWNGSPWEAS